MESGKDNRYWRKKEENPANKNQNTQKQPNITKLQPKHAHRKTDDESSKQSQLKSAIKEHTSSHKSGKHKPSFYQQRFLKVASSKNVQTFSVMSYNLLANCNISKQYFPYCRRHELDWFQRHPKIVKRIHRFAADVLCFQEVEFFPQLEAELAKSNYAGIFKKRTGQNQDGCAIFYNSKKFELLEHSLVEYNQSHKVEWMDRDNVAIVCMLKSLGKPTTFTNNENNNQPEDQLICVANTHLLFNPKRGDIKLAQLQILFQAIKQLLDKYAKSSPGLVVCGDLNLTPNSFLFDCIQRGSANVDRMNVRTASGQLVGTYVLKKSESDSDPMDSEDTSNNQCLLHDIELKSAYQQHYEDDEIVTSYHTTFKGTVDYVWYSPGKLVLQQLLSVPTVAEVDSGMLGKGLPNIVQPSDHLPLGAQFGFGHQ